MLELKNISFERDNKKIVSVTSLEYPPQYYSGNMITYNGYNLTLGG